MFLIFFINRGGGELKKVSFYSIFHLKNYHKFEINKEKKFKIKNSFIFIDFRSS